MTILTAWSRVEVAERMTAAEFWMDAPEDQKAELIDGVMILAPPPLQIHEELFGFLFSLIRMYTEEYDLGDGSQARGLGLQGDAAPSHTIKD